MGVSTVLAGVPWGDVASAMWMSVHRTRPRRPSTASTGSAVSPSNRSPVNVSPETVKSAVGQALPTMRWSIPNRSSREPSTLGDPRAGRTVTRESGRRAARDAERAQPEPAPERSTSRRSYVPADKSVNRQGENVPASVRLQSDSPPGDETRGVSDARCGPSSPPRVLHVLIGGRGTRFASGWDSAGSARA